METNIQESQEEISKSTEQHAATSTHSSHWHSFCHGECSSAQNKLQRLQAVLQGDDDQAKSQIFGALVHAVAPHVLGIVLDTAENEMELAGAQEDDETEVQQTWNINFAMVQQVKGSLEGYRITMIWPRFKSSLSN